MKCGFSNGIDANEDQKYITGDDSKDYCDEFDDYDDCYICGDDDDRSE